MENSSQNKHFHDPTPPGKLSNVALRERLISTERCEQELVAASLRDLVEVRQRELHLLAGFDSLAPYCVEVLGMDRGKAQKRSRLARLLSECPEAGRYLDSGEITVSGLHVLAPHVTSANCEVLLDWARGRSKRELEMCAADMRGPRRPPKEPTVTPMADGMNSIVALVVPNELLELFDRVADLLGEGTARRDMAKVLGTALADYEQLLRRQRRGETKRSQKEARERARLEPSQAAPVSQLVPGDEPAVSGTEASCQDNRNWPPGLKRSVYARDEDRCTFVSPDGRRCSATTDLHIDHIKSFALGGLPLLHNVRIRCGAHNRYTAKLELGSRAYNPLKKAPEDDDPSGTEGGK